MKNLNSLNGRIMQEKLKVGWTTSEFAQYYQVTEEEFLKRLQKVFSHKAYQDMTARLKQNAKRKRHETEAIVNNEPENVCFEETFSTVDEESDSEKELTEPRISGEYASEEDKKKVGKAKFIKRLTALEDLKNACETELNRLELRHKELCSDKAAIRKAISNFRQKLVELQNTIQEYRQQVITLTEGLNEKQEMMRNVNSLISARRRKLREVEAEIQGLRKVSILVYDSGVIELDAQYDIEIPELTWTTLFDKIVKYEQAGSLTINQIKAVAKLVCMMGFFREHGICFDTIIENPNLEEFLTVILNN